MSVARSTRLPTFVIGGAMRSGTTALNAWLRSHPDVFMAAAKEVHFFDRHYDRGMDWYHPHFEGSEAATAVGEATPNYLYHPNALERLSRDVPGVQVVILLRDPVERAHSHFLHRRSTGGESLCFEDAIDREEARLRGADELTRAHYSYVDRGRYLNQLERLLGLFESDRVLIHLFEDLRDRPQEVYGGVTRFIGARDDQASEAVGRASNVYQEFRSRRIREFTRRMPSPVRGLVGRLNRVPVPEYPVISDKARERLQAAYASERPQLEKLLGRNLDCWSA